MSFIIERPATDEDKERLQRASTRFLKRHGERLRRYVHIDSESTWLPLEVYLGCEVYDEHNRESRIKLVPLYRRVARRALRSTESDEVAYDSVGHSGRNQL